MATALTPADEQRAAFALGVTAAHIRAVRTVEAPGGGFLLDGRPKVLFEAHVFGQRTGYRFNRSHPGISSKHWNRALYAKGGTAEIRGIREHDRLAVAAELDRDAALQSASWGMFQVMGFNWRACGFASLQDFVNAMYASEGRQLDAFTGYVQSRGLADELRRQDWAGFAYGYNGSGYSQNKYDVKLAAAFRKHSEACKP